MEWLLEPLRYEFLQRGLIVALVVGIACPVIGSFVVVRSMAFLGDALAHAILPGVAVAYLLGTDLTAGALVAALLVAFGISFFSREGTLKEDTAIGILFSAALALGVALISTLRTYATDLSHILFGNILGVSNFNLVFTTAVAALVLLAVFFLYRQFLIVSFDPVLAKTLRLPVPFFRGLLLVLLALMITAALQSVGVGLVSALLVTPAAAAYLFTRRLRSMMILASVFGAFSGVVGLYLSYYLNIASGASIVLTATLIFLIAFFFAPERGLLRRFYPRRAA